MKTPWLLLFFLMGGISLAQNNPYGIYKRSQDYLKGNLSPALSCNSSDRIRLKDFLDENHVVIILNGKELRFNKDSIFGYRNCKQNDFRFYRNHEKEYQILENRTIVIYVTDIAVPSSSGKTKNLVPAYFFSTTLDGNIFSLTIINLKRAFPDNLKFHDALDVAFAYGTALSTYDSEHKMYKINFLLKQSLEQ